MLLDSFIAEDVLRALYAAADGVFANSEREPFGLGGLEVMAYGGIAYVGRTGEDYAIRYGTASWCRPDDPRELSAHLRTMAANQHLAVRIRSEGQATAERFSWPRVPDLYEAAWSAARGVGR